MPKIPLWQVPNAPKIPEGTLIPMIPPPKGSKPYKIKPLQRGFLAPNAFTGPGGALAKVGESVVEVARKALPEVKAYDKAFAVLKDVGDVFKAEDIMRTAKAAFAKQMENLPREQWVSQWQKHGIQVEKQLGDLKLTDEVKDKVEPKLAHFNNTQQIQIHYAVKRKETEDYDQVLEKTAQEREAAGDYDGVLDVYDARLATGLWSRDQYRQNLGTMEVRHQERMVEEATKRNPMEVYRHLQSAKETGKSDLFEWMGKEQIEAKLEKLEPLVLNFQADKRYEYYQGIVRGDIRNVEKVQELSGDLYTTEERAEFGKMIAAKPQHDAEVMNRLRTAVAQYGVGEDRDGSGYKALSMQIMMEAPREKREALLEELYAKQVQRREGKTLTPRQRLKAVIYNEADVYAQQGKLDYTALSGIKDGIEQMMPQEVKPATFKELRGWLREEVDAAALRSMPYSTLPGQTMPPKSIPYDGGNKEGHYDGDVPGVFEEPDYWQKMQARWHIGGLQARADQQSYRAANGEIPWESVTEEIAAGERERNKGGNIFSEGFLSAVEMLPAMVESENDGVKNGLVTGGGFAGVTAIAGQVGPQVALPEEIITVPVAAISGFGVGHTYGVMTYWYRQGVGSLYHTLRKEGIPHPVAGRIAKIFGVPYAAIEFSQITKIVPGLRAATNKVIGKTIRETMALLAKRHGVEYIAQIVEEEMQEIISIIGEKLGEIISGVEPSPEKQGIWERLLNAARQTAMSIPFFQAPKFVVDAKTHIDQTRSQASSLPASQKENPISEISADSNPNNLSEISAGVINESNERTGRDALLWWSSSPREGASGGSGRGQEAAQRARTVVGRGIEALGVEIHEKITGRPPGMGYDSSGNLRLIFDQSFLGDLETQAQKRGVEEDAYSNLIFGEELIHAAHLKALKDDWIAEGKRGSFIEFVDGRQKTLFDDIEATLKETNSKERFILQRTLTASMNSYFSDFKYESNVSAGLVFEKIRNSKNPAQATSVFVAEFLRQAVQLKRQGAVSENVLVRLLNILGDWVRPALHQIRKTLPEAFEGKYGEKVKETLERIENELDEIDENLPPKIGELPLPEEEDSQ